MAPGGPEWPDEEDHAVAVAAQADAVVSLERRRNRMLRDEPAPYAGRHRAVEVEETLPMVPVELASTALRCAA